MKGSQIWVLFEPEVCTEWGCRSSSEQILGVRVLWDHQYRPHRGCEETMETFTNRKKSLCLMRKNLPWVIEPGTGLTKVCLSRLLILFYIVFLQMFYCFLQLCKVGFVTRLLRWLKSQDEVIEIKVMWEMRWLIVVQYTARVHAFPGTLGCLLGMRRWETGPFSQLWRWKELTNFRCNLKKTITWVG